MFLYECVCCECGYRFEMPTQRAASQMCPRCGGIDFDAVPRPEDTPVTALTADGDGWFSTAA